MSSHIDSICARYVGRGREALLPILWDAQTAHGSINAAQVQRISHTLRIPEADIFGVIGFYTLFHDQPTGRRLIRVCTDPSCALADADAVLHDVCARLGIHEGETTADGEYTVEHSPCLGMCDYAPAALVSAHGEADKALPHVDADTLLGDWSGDYFTPAGDADSTLLDGNLPAAPQTLADYGDYTALDIARGMTPDEVIAQVEASGLIGRGGAAFPHRLEVEVHAGCRWRAKVHRLQC